MQKPKRIKPTPRPADWPDEGFFLLTRDQKSTHVEEIEIDGTLYALAKALAQPNAPREAALIAFLKDGGEPDGVVLKTLTRAQWKAACDLTIKMDKLCPAA